MRNNFGFNNKLPRSLFDSGRRSASRNGRRKFQRNNVVQTVSRRHGVVIRRLRAGTYYFRYKVCCGNGQCFACNAFDCHKEDYGRILKKVIIAFFVVIINRQPFFRIIILFLPALQQKYITNPRVRHIKRNRIVIIERVRISNRP